MTGNGGGESLAVTLSSERLDDAEVVRVAVEARIVLERFDRGLVDPRVKRPNKAQRAVARVLYALASEVIALRDEERRAAAEAATAMPPNEPPPTDADLDRIERCLPERDSSVAAGLMEATTHEGRIESFDSDDIRRLVDEVRRCRAHAPAGCFAVDTRDPGPRKGGPEQ